MPLVSVQLTTDTDFFIKTDTGSRIKVGEEDVPNPPGYKTPTVWEGSTKTAAVWTPTPETPRVWTPSPETRAPANWSLTPKTARTWRSTDEQQVPYLYDDATKTYDDAGRFYDYLNTVDNQLNNNNPTVWLP